MLLQELVLQELQQELHEQLQLPSMASLVSLKSVSSNVSDSSSSSSRASSLVSVFSTWAGFWIMGTSTGRAPALAKRIALIDSPIQPPASSGRAVCALATACHLAVTFTAMTRCSLARHAWPSCICDHRPRAAGFIETDAGPDAG